MKVQPSNASTVSALHGPSAPVPAAGSAKPSSGSKGGDRVQISMLSKYLDAQPMAHASKIAELSREVSSGRYHVDSQVVSNKLIQEHLRPAA